VVADDDSRADDHIWSEMDALAELGGRVDDSSRMDARWVLWTSVKELQRARKGMVRVGQPQRGKGNGRKVGFNEDRPGAGLLGEGRVLWVGDKGELVWPGLFDARDTFNIRFSAYSETPNICFSACRRGSVRRGLSQSTGRAIGEGRRTQLSA